MSVAYLNPHTKEGSDFLASVEQHTRPNPHNSHDDKWVYTNQDLPPEILNAFENGGTTSSPGKRFDDGRTLRWGRHAEREAFEAGMYDIIKDRSGRHFTDDSEIREWAEAWGLKWLFRTGYGKEAVNKQAERGLLWGAIGMWNVELVISDLAGLFPTMGGICRFAMRINAFEHLGVWYVETLEQFEDGGDNEALRSCMIDIASEMCCRCCIPEWMLSPLGELESGIAPFAVLKNRARDHNIPLDNPAAIAASLGRVWSELTPFFHHEDARRAELFRNVIKGAFNDVDPRSLKLLANHLPRG